MPRRPSQSTRNHTMKLDRLDDIDFGFLGIDEQVPVQLDLHLRRPARFDNDDDRADVLGDVHVAEEERADRVLADIDVDVLHAFTFGT